MCDTDKEQDISQQVIYLDENTVILEEDNEVQYVIPSNLAEANGYLVEQDNVHFDYINNGDNILDDKNQILIPQEELVDSQIITKEDSSMPYEVESEGSEHVTQLILNEEQCQLLQGYGRLVLLQGSKRYLLDGEGLREIQDDFDLDSLNNYEYVLSTQDNCEGQNDILLTDNNISFENNSQVLQVIDENNHDDAETAMDHNIKLQEELQKSSTWITNTSESNNLNQQTSLIKMTNPSEINSKFQNQKLPGKRKSTGGFSLQLVAVKKPANKLEWVKSQNKETPGKSTGCDSDKKIFIGKTDDGKKLYGKIIGVKTAKSDDNVINKNYKCSLSSKVLNQLLETGKKIVKHSPKRFVQSQRIKNIPNRTKSTESEKIVIGKDDAKVREFFYDNIEEKELNTEPIHVGDSKNVNEVAESSQNNWFEVPVDEETDPEQLNKDIEYIKKIMSTIQSVPHVMKVITGKDLMFCKVFENKTDSLSDENKKLFITGRMVKINNEWQFVHTSELHNYEDTDKQSKRDWVVIKLMVSTVGNRQTTQIVLCEKGKEDASSILDEEVMKEDDEFSGIDISQKNWSKSYVCDICKKPFNRLSNLLRHARIHSSNDNHVVMATSSKSKPKSSQEGGEYACQLCPCSYKYPSTLTRHILAQHTDYVIVNK